MEVDASMAGEADQQQGPPQHHQQLPSSLSGPAPTYRAANAIIENKDDGPGPRCGHTLTAVAAVGDEGSPGFIAVWISPPILCHVFRVQTVMTKLTPVGDPPSPRAAHAATAVGTMVVIQGGRARTRARTSIWSCYVPSGSTVSPTNQWKRWKASTCRCVGIRHSSKAILMAKVRTGRRWSTSLHVRDSQRPVRWSSTSLWWTGCEQRA